MILHGSHHSFRKRIHQFIDHVIALYSEFQNGFKVISISQFCQRGMELLRKQLRIWSPEIFLILGAKRKQKQNMELSNSPVKTCKRHNHLFLKL